MLKRLIIAVFGISLVLAFGSFALAGPGNPPQYELEPAVPHVVQNPAKSDANEYDIHRDPTFKKPASALQVLPSGTNIPGTPTSIYFGDMQDYSGTPHYYFTLPDAYGDNLNNTRFTVEAGLEVTLKVAHLLMYRPAMVGTPALRVYLWSDDGFGFPGALLDSVTIPNSALPTTAVGYASANFSAAGWMFAEGDHYHYGWKPVGTGKLAVIADDGSGPFAGQERSSENYQGTWGSILNDWGTDAVMSIISERTTSAITFTDCYTQQYFFPADLANLWRSPHPSYGDSSWAQRFDVGGPETLASVDFSVFDHTLLGLTDPAGDQDLYITVYDDDGSGLPGALIIQKTVLAGSYAFYPAEISVSFAPLVLENTFHIAFSTNGVWNGVFGTQPADMYETICANDGSPGNGRANNCWEGGPWVPMVAPFNWGVDSDFYIKANLCRDEFAACAIQDYYGAGDPPGGPGLAAPNATAAAGIAKWAQRFTNAPTGSSCELRQLFFAFTRIAGEVATRPLMYTKNTLVHVVADAGGEPSSGAPLYTATLTPADYAAAGYTGSGFVGNIYFTLTPNVTIPANFWVVFEPLAAIRAEGIRVSARITTSDPAGVDAWCKGYHAGAAGWFNVPDFFAGTVLNAGANVEAKVCCVPISDRTCTPPDDWPARAHDMARTGVSQLSIGDAWCDLNVNWFRDETTAATALTMSPVIYKNRVYQILETAAAGSSIRVYNLVSGALEQTIVLDTPGVPNATQNDPLLINDKLYICGGGNRVVYRYDVSVPGAAVLNWTRQIGAAALGSLRVANLVMVNVGGTNVLYGGSSLGRVFAVNESDGTLYNPAGPGWDINPITLDVDQPIYGSATDGSQLYFGTGELFLLGDVWTLDPATGSTVWKLSSAGGFQGNNLYTPTVNAEAFPKLSVEAGVLYVAGSAEGNYPVEGVFYRLKTSDGAVLSATAFADPFFCDPIIDIDKIYIGVRSVYSAPVFPAEKGQTFAFSKRTGSIEWVSETQYESHLNDRVRHTEILTCEPDPASDILIAGSDGGIVKFLNSSDGSDLFNRRWDFGPGTASRSGGPAIGIDNLGDVHVLVGSFRGALVDLKKGADRPRLEIQDYDPTIPVEFSLATSVIYTVPNIITNTGCADLTFNAVTADAISFGSTDPGVAPIIPVKPGLLNAASQLAEQLTSNSKEFKLVTRDLSDDLSLNDEFQTTSEESFRSERGYRAALAVPAYLNSVDEPYSGQVVMPGDSIPLVIDVNASIIKRGPQIFYIELNTSDPDFFLGAGSVAQPNEHPQLVITLVGGCLDDTTALEFGVGGANYQWVTNTGRLGDGDWDAHGFEIDGQDTYFYQGGYIFGVSTERVAFDCADWSGATGPEASWNSIQGDPNYCDIDCKPALITGVSLGAIGYDGLVYTTITGNMVCKSWIDSVQNFSAAPPVVAPATWNWKRFTAPFNDSLTMGLSANTRTIGALGVPALANLTVEIFEVTNRNNRNVNNWKFGVNIDYDLATQLGGGTDTAVVDRNISAAWTTASSNPNAAYAYGFIKLPFGCGYEPLKNARALDAGQGHFIASGGAARSDGYMDSAYTYMSAAPGEYSQPGLAASPDQQIHGTLIENNFGPNGKLKFAVAEFGYNSGISDPWADGGGGELAATAHLVNKWVGFGRGDVNDDNAINLGDVMALADIVGGSGGAIPFAHLADVNADNSINNADLNYLINYYFGCGPCPLGDWRF